MVSTAVRSLNIARQVGVWSAHLIPVDQLMAGPSFREDIAPMALGPPLRFSGPYSSFHRRSKRQNNAQAWGCEHKQLTRLKQDCPRDFHITGVADGLETVFAQHRTWDERGCCALLVEGPE